MPDFSDPKAVALLVGFVAFNTAVFGFFVGLFRPSDSGFFALNGQFGGWAICLAASLGFTVLSLFEPPILLSIVAWWVVALMVFRLTVRQTCKLNIALGLLYLAIVFGTAAVK